MKRPPKNFDGECCVDACPKCGSTNTYLSPNGYDTVRVCRACHSEWHVPFGKEKKK